MATNLPSIWVSSLGWVFYHFLWQACVVALALWLANRLLRHASPRSRYACSWLALALCAVLPVISYLRFLSSGDSATGIVRTLGLNPPVAQLGLLSLRFTDQGLPVLGVSMNEARQRAVLLTVLPLAGVWLLGSAFALWRLRRGWSVLLRHMSGASPASPEVERLAAETARTLGLSAVPACRQSGHFASPVITGVWRLALVVPTDFSKSFNQEEQRMLIAHELAHVERGDPRRHALQCLLEGLFFWHPAVLWISNTIRCERELCSDERAAVALGHRHELANALAHMAEHAGFNACLTLGANRGSLLERIRALLDQSFPRAHQRGRLIIAFACMSLCLLSVFFAHVNMGPVPFKRPPME